MRIETIEVVWFRGAADMAVLSPNSKSMLVYGENGSGKSSFIDAIEYVLNKGKIGHLTHEYSGRRQEKGIINTHLPEGRKAEIRIKFKDGSRLAIEIERNGTSMSSGAEAVAMSSWDYGRSVLRQDEVANFIRDTKGEKYSALLPLFGLYRMEVAAENLRQLVKTVEQQSNLKETKIELRKAEMKREAVFGAVDDDQIAIKIEELHKMYCADRKATTDPVTRCNEIQAALSDRIERLTVDQRRHLILQEVADLNLRDLVGAARSINLQLVGTAEPLIAERLEILKSTSIFVNRLGDEKEVKCPACGKSISTEEFQAHVTAEKSRLREITCVFDARKAAVGVLSDTIKTIKSGLGKTDVKLWRDDLIKESLAENFIYLEGFDAEALRSSCTEEDLKQIESKLLPLIGAAASASKDVPPDAKQLSTDKQVVETGKEMIVARELAATAERADVLVGFINYLAQGVRKEIKQRSQKVIDEISSDIQSMWSILHPGEPIENVRLYIPEDTDKAIDIALKFHGVEQDSPRLTLSEGNRNSLGLCIFLAMAKREGSKDRPLFLDDVVISLDRNHRGMILELLEKEFSGRQVIVLTHDREWYTELRQQLDGAKWIFKALMPYEKPEIGIRWSEKASTFDDARSLLDDRPDAAGNTVRKIMDIELAVRAERLKVKLPYLHREKNDHRTAHDFLSCIVSDGEQCFKKKDTKEYEPYNEAIEAFREADRLLISWGNRSSHSFDVVRSEAEKLIAVCEKALEFFDCPRCRKSVYKLDDQRAEFVQCECGHLQWRYGKA